MGTIILRQPGEPSKKKVTPKYRKINKLLTVLLMLSIYANIYLYGR